MDALLGPIVADASDASDVAVRTRPIFERLRSVIPENNWPHLAPYIDEVLRLKAERNAVILAHNYMTPDIFHGIADIRGDSLALAREAMETDADVIVVCGVHFMAETAKILNPTKTVLIPDPLAGCSLAESITGEDLRQLRKKYPGVPIVSYVNTTADVKAETDICCTSANAKKIVESLGVDRVIMTPDEFLARNVAAQTDVEIIAWSGRCMVHETFEAGQIDRLRKAHPDVVVLAHPECSPDVLGRADYSGSTAGMADYIAQHRPARAALITECSMSSNLASEYPETQFIRSCSLCPHMQRITIDKVADCLRDMTPEVTVDPDIARRARRSVERMIEVGRN